MEPVQTFAYAKLTRTLRVTGRRSDGYHLLDSEMVTLDLADELVISMGDGLELRDQLEWTQGRRLDPGGGIEPEPSAELTTVPSGADNLVVRALELAGKTAFVRLTKKIPSGAGLGGGSADAAAILRWGGFKEPHLAAELGADVPFCLRGGRAWVTGIGEELAPLPFEKHTVVLVTPGFPVSTPAVYAAYDELDAKPSGLNDLEDAAIAVDPRLGRWRDFLREVVGHRPVLAGSGATYFIECDGVGAATEQAVRVAIDQAGLRAQVRLCQTVPELSSIG